MTQTIGQRLKAAREGQRLTLEKVFEATRIRMQYLQALEEDDLSAMPSPVQARGYLRNYAEYLGLDVDKMLHELRQQNAQQPTGALIGPADAAPPPQGENQAPESEPAVQALQAPDIVTDTPAEVQTIPIKPKPVRRKKPVSEPAPATAEPPTRRRRRTKNDPEEIPVVEAEPASTEDPVSAVEPVPQPGKVEETVSETESAAPVESFDAEIVGESPEEPPPVDAGDKIWQKWLSRIGSRLSARTKRRTLTPKESFPPEIEPVVDLPDVPVDVEAHNDDLETYEQILIEIGRELRQRRELLSLHFDEVERTTHVKAYYLDALERGALEDLPSTVQTRGMLSNYATFLDLDVDALLLRFADALQVRHRERNPQKTARKPGQPILTNIPPVRSFIAGDMIFGVGVAILLVGFSIWGVNRVMTIQSQREVQPTAISISDVLLSSPDPSSFTATATFIAVETFPGEATVTVEIPTQNVNAEVQLNLVAVERTYLRVIVDGEVAFDGRVVPGNAYPFEAENQIEVLVGSGAAIRIVYNGRDLGLMGTFGQVVNNIYLGTEILTPTGLPTTTPTITPTPTRTAVPTATSRFTDTPVPSATAVP